MCGDLFHAGHVNLLRQARALGDELVVGVMNDADMTAYKRAPVMTMAERIAVIAACRYVDRVVPDAPTRPTAAFLDGLGVTLVCHGDDYTAARSKTITARFGRRTAWCCCPIRQPFRPRTSSRASEAPASSAIERRPGHVPRAVALPCALSNEALFYGAFTGAPLPRRDPRLGSPSTGGCFDHTSKPGYSVLPLMNRRGRAREISASHAAFRRGAVAIHEIDPPCDVGPCDRRLRRRLRGAGVPRTTRATARDDGASVGIHHRRANGRTRSDRRLGQTSQVR